MSLSIQHRLLLYNSLVLLRHSEAELIQLLEETGEIPEREQIMQHANSILGMRKRIQETINTAKQDDESLL